MNDESSPRLFETGTIVASVAVVVASASDALLHAIPRRVPLLLCVAGYLVVVTLGSFAVDRRPRLLGMLVVALLVVGCAAVWISDGRTILILMPLIVLVTLRYSRPTVWGLLVFLGGWVALALEPSGDSERAVVQAVGAFLAAALFTVVVSRIDLRERQARRQLAIGRERNRIAREIHGGLGHYLAAANIQLQAAREIVADRPAGQHLRCAQALLHQGLNELHHTASVLRADRDQRALSRAVGNLIEEARAGGLAGDLHVNGEVRPLDSAVELALYRAAQEALASVRRHTGARRADVKIHTAKGR